MARVLYVGSGNPWIGGAGYLVRQNLFLSSLGQVADLHLAMFDRKPGPAPAYVKSVVSLEKPFRPAGSKMKNLVHDLTDPLPRMYRGFDWKQHRRQLKNLDANSYDAVFSYRIDFGFFADVLHHRRLVLDIDDPEHLRGLRRVQSVAGNPDPRTVFDLEMLRQFETRSVAGAKLAFVCQENDRGGWPIQPEVVPNCVEIQTAPRRAVTKPVVLFVGNCAGGPTSPNVDAVLFFIADIWPRVLQNVPDAEFHLVGAVSEAVKSAVEKSPRMQLRGFVDDLADVYAQTAVSVAPIRFGTGTRIKILEAFAHACPVVSTLAGAEGIEAIPGREIELGVGDDDFAVRTVELLKNQKTAEAIGQGGYQLAVGSYNAQTQRQKLAARFNEFLNKKASP